jgi:predicted transcriptional regulator
MEIIFENLPKTLTQLTIEEVRRILEAQTFLKEISERLGEHDAQINQIYDALENLIDEKASQRKWEARDRIGFSKE